MPMQSGKLSKLAPKLKATFTKVKDEPPTFGQMELPPIENGVARLVECKLDTIKAGKQNAGQLFFYAAGVVVSPDKVNGVSVKGRRTSIMEPLYPTPTRKTAQTVQEHFEIVLNELKKLGVDTGSFSEETFDAETEAAMEQLVKEKPFFGFRTYKYSKIEIEKKEDGKFYVGDKKYPTYEAAKKANRYAGEEPRTNHDWHGVIEGYDPDNATVEEDNTEEVETEEAAEETATEEAEPAADDFDVDTMLEAAKGDDGDAQTALREKAAELGATEEWMDGDDTSWDMIADCIRNGGPVADEVPAEIEPVTEEEKVEWKKGDVTKYPLLDAKGKPKLNAKKKPMFVECELTAFDKAKKTWTLKNLDDGRTLYKDVKESSLVAPD